MFCIASFIRWLFHFQNSLHYYPAHNHTSTEQIHFRQKRSVWYDLFNCLQGNQEYRNLIIKSRRRQGVVNSVSLIDRVSRVLFPMSFGALNVAYWVAYTKSDPRVDIGASDLHFMQWRMFLVKGNGMIFICVFIAGMCLSCLLGESTLAQEQQYV
jgi:hypothetical protein